MGPRVLSYSRTDRTGTCRARPHACQGRAVPFEARHYFDTFEGRVSNEVVGVDDIDVKLVIVERIGDVVEHILSHDFVIELSRATDVKNETSHFTAHFTILDLVPIIFGITRGEFCDVIPIVNLVGHVAQEIAEWNVGLTWTPTIDDRVRVEVEGLLFQLFQGLVQFETGMASGESRDEDVGFSVV